MLIAGIERLLAVGAPISRATVPLINGLARRRLVRTGVEQREARVNGIALNYYFKAPRQPAPDAVPIVLIHGSADTLIPVSHAHAFYAAAREPKERWIVAGVDHCGAYFHDRAGYIERVSTFFAHHLNGVEFECS